MFTYISGEQPAQPHHDIILSLTEERGSTATGHHIVSLRRVNVRGMTVESADLALKATPPLAPSALHLKACAGAKLPGSRSVGRAADTAVLISLGAGSDPKVERTEQGQTEALEALCYTDLGFICKRLGPDL